eukprot:NODE_241_length_13209_cov_0.424256.p8 type:complete len:143 gc:universal NODE_241_length_13209_cov_0.424256:631-1059(+)
MLIKRKTFKIHMQPRPSIVGYILFNIGLFLFHLPSNWLYMFVLFIFSLVCTLHHLYDPDFVYFEKWVLLVLSIYMCVFLYLYLFKLDIIYQKLLKYIPSLNFNETLLIMYILSIQFCLVSSVIVIFASSQRRYLTTKQLYLV